MRNKQETGHSRLIRTGGIFIGSGIATLAIACGGGKGTESKVQKADPPTLPAATDVLKSSPTEAPSPIPTQEVKQAVSCVILPTEYCSQAEVVDWTSPQGQKFKVVGVNLPADVPIYSPIDGDLVRGPSSAFNGTTGSLRDLTASTYTSFSWAGDFRFKVFTADVNQVSVKKGDIIGFTESNGIANLGYSLIFTVTRLNQETNAPYTPVDVLSEYFPAK